MGLCQAMFRAVGIGHSHSLPAAAALNWVMKDGLGRLCRCIYTASLASAFDTNLKACLLFHFEFGSHCYLICFDLFKVFYFILIHCGPCSYHHFIWCLEKVIQKSENEVMFVVLKNYKLRIIYHRIRT